MNSYPPELLAQLAPVMFVAGLNPPPPSSPPIASETPSKQPPQDPFQVLSLRLREALASQRKPAIYQPDKGKTFHVVLVDKEIRFPPRKLLPPEDPQYSAAHSPLSPLTPTSPLHPDGLIAPIWLRKHTSLVPSVFVMFLRIFESPSYASKSPLDLPENDKERELEERRKDAELAAEVALRKKSTNERGIKLTVVLMASRKMLDDPALDARLTFIRKHSGLDSRAALFVLSPVSAAELGEFVKSLQQALYEPALEYYTAHSKRVRRKRNRHSSQAASYPAPISSINIARPLRPEGWTVRYEYKMACFAEFRGEDEVALKHYQDSYAMLVVMFGSTAILPPRTKRWAEAKVLADCIDIKVVKLYLYNNEHALALSHHNTHIRKFGDFSRGWGIGEETFEYWSWVARQHRILAELLEQGTHSTLVIPSHSPAPLLSASLATSPAVAPRGLEADAMRTLGINPSHALQHPGFYYYMAARGTEMRRERYLAIEAELSQKPTALSPGFTNEKKVDHLGVILELYTKSYELFKKYSPGGGTQSQGRLTLWIAYRIAQTYYDSGKFDLAIRFFERIARTYRRESWDTMLRPLLSTWYACVQQLGDVDLSVRLLIEMMGHDLMEDQDPNSLEEDLLAVLQSTVPASTNEPLVVDLSDARSIFDSNVVFWNSEIKVDELAVFQLSLTAPQNVIVSSIPFSSLCIYFSNSEVPVTVKHSDSKAGSTSLVQRIDLGEVTSQKSTTESEVVEANLRWPPGSTLVFTGLMTSDVPTVLEITKLVLTIEENTWKVKIPFSPYITRQGIPITPRWLCSLDPPRFMPINREDCSSVIVKHRPHQLKVAMNHHSPAYLDEEYPIEIEVTNVDCRDLHLTLDVLLHPTEFDDTVNSIRIGEERSASLIKGINLGFVSPGVSVIKTLYIINTGAAGDRMLDVSIRSRANSTGLNTDDSDSEADTPQDIMENLQTLVVPAIEPLKVVQDVIYRRSLTKWPGLADLTVFDDEYWDDKRGGEAVINVKMECVGPWGIEVKSVSLEKEDNENAKIIDSSTDVTDDDLFPAEYLPGDELGVSCRVSIAPVENELVQEPIPCPGRYIVTWWKLLEGGERGAVTRSVFPLQSLQPPMYDLVALLDTPPKATLHRPISLHLTIRNYHSSRSAAITVQLEPDAQDGFVIAGLRSGRIPVLLPGTEEILTWSLIPIECGYVKLPLIKVFDRRKSFVNDQGGGEPPAPADSHGVEVKVIDIRWDQRRAPNDSDISKDSAESLPEPGTILVLP